MALDKVRLLVNKIRRLEENNDNGEYNSKIDDLQEELCNEITKSNLKVKIVAKIEKEICLKDVDNWEDWLIERLLDEENTSSPIEILAEDICKSGEDFEYYVNFDDDIDVTVYNTDGKEICTHKI